MVPSAVNEAIAWSRLLRRKDSLESSVAPTSTGESGSGRQRYYAQLCEVGLGLSQRPKRRRPYQRRADRAAPQGLQRQFVRAHRKAAPALLRTQRCQDTGSAGCRRRYRWSTPIACERGISASEVPIRVRGHQDVGSPVIGPRHREPGRIGVRNQLEAEINVAGLEKHPIEVVDILAHRILADLVRLRFKQQRLGDRLRRSCGRPADRDRGHRDSIAAWHRPGGGRISIRQARRACPASAPPQCRQRRIGERRRTP